MVIWFDFTQLLDGTPKKAKAANLIALDSYPFDDLHLLAHKKHLRFVSLGSN